MLHWLPSTEATLIAVSAYAVVLLFGSILLKHPITWKAWFLPPAAATIVYVLTVAFIETTMAADSVEDPIYAFLAVLFSTTITGALWLALLCPFIARAVPWARIARSRGANASSS